MDYFTCYDTNKQLVGRSTRLYSTHSRRHCMSILFNDKPPERNNDYIRELDKVARVSPGAEVNSVSDFKHLIGSYHVDDKRFVIVCNQKSNVQKMISGRIQGLDHK
jgi:hypothetical protein